MYRHPYHSNTTTQQTIEFKLTQTYPHSNMSVPIPGQTNANSPRVVPSMIYERMTYTNPHAQHCQSDPNRTSQYISMSVGRCPSSQHIQYPCGHGRHHQRYPRHADPFRGRPDALSATRRGTPADGSCDRADRRARHNAACIVVHRKRNTRELSEPDGRRCMSENRIDVFLRGFSSERTAGCV